MSALLLLANPHFANKAIAMAGYAAGLGQMDIRDLSETRIPLWTVVAGSLVVGVAGGIWIARKLPRDWIVSDDR